MKLTAVGQRATTRWWGMDNVLTTDLGGDVTVQEIHGTGYTLVPEPDHPAYPGAVSFEIAEMGGMKTLRVMGVSTAPIPSGNRDLYDIASSFYWSQYSAQITKQIIGTDPRFVR